MFGKSHDEFLKSHLRYGAARKSGYNKYSGRKSQLKNLYGLSMDKYEGLLEKQENKCAVCGIDFQLLTRNPHIDHNHNTGEIRGILCSNCNTALGLLKDDVVRVQKLMEYIVKFQERE
jgi:hypothetical protein